MLDRGGNFIFHVSKCLQVMPQDAGPYRCRVDFLRAPTRNVKIKLSLIGKTILFHLITWCIIWALTVCVSSSELPSTPVIYDGVGSVIEHFSAPLKLGSHLKLKCETKGGEWL